MRGRDSRFKSSYVGALPPFQSFSLHRPLPGLGAELGLEELAHVLRVALHAAANVREVGPQRLLGADPHQHRRLHRRALLLRQLRVLFRIFGSFGLDLQREARGRARIGCVDGARGVSRGRTPTKWRAYGLS